MTDKDERQIFLAEVIVGDSIELDKNRSLVIPPIRPTKGAELAVERYDSVTGVTRGTRVYIVCTPLSSFF